MFINSHCFLFFLIFCNLTTSFEKRNLQPLYNIKINMVNTIFEVTMLQIKKCTTLYFLYIELLFLKKFTKHSNYAYKTDDYLFPE